MWVAPHLQLESYQLLPALRGIVLSFSFFWLFLTVALDLGRVESFAPSLGTLLVSVVLFNNARNIYCLAWLIRDNMFKRIFFFFFFLAVRSEVDQIAS